MDSAPQSRSARDVLVVDLRGLKRRLLELAATRGVSLSDLVRALLSSALEVDGPAPASCRRTWTPPVDRARVRVSLTLSNGEASALSSAARQARLSLGAFVSELAANTPVLAAAAGHPDRIAALVASCAEMSTLSRDLHHLGQLLQQGSVQAARSYYETLARLETDVRQHLCIAAEVLATLGQGRDAGVKRAGRQG